MTGKFREDYEDLLIDKVSLFVHFRFNFLIEEIYQQCPNEECLYKCIHEPHLAKRALSVAVT